MRKAACTLIALVFGVACGTPAQPTNPPQPTPGPTEVVTPRLTGRTWFHFGYNPSTHRAEVWRLEVRRQDEATFRGVFQRSGTPDQPFTGTLFGARKVEIVAGMTTLSGTIPNDLNTESWPFAVSGGGYSGNDLSFRPVLGEPTSPPPEASLQIRTGNAGAPAIMALTKIDYDGSGSRGDEPSYLLEFGDDQFVSVARAFHVVDRDPNYFTARMTVVDRFGRANTKSVTFGVFVLNVVFSSWYFVEGNTFLHFIFDRRTGVRYEGRLNYGFPSRGGQTVAFSAILSGESDIQIVVPALGLEFRGYIDMSNYLYPMTLKQYGGADDGRTWKLRYDDGPG